MMTLPSIQILAGKWQYNVNIKYSNMSQILNFFTDEEGFSFHSDTISFIKID